MKKKKVTKKVTKKVIEKAKNTIDSLSLLKKLKGMHTDTAALVITHKTYDIPAYTTVTRKVKSIIYPEKMSRDAVARYMWAKISSLKTAKKNPWPFFYIILEAEEARANGFFSLDPNNKNKSLFHLILDNGTFERGVFTRPFMSGSEKIKLALA